MIGSENSCNFLNSQKQTATNRDLFTSFFPRSNQYPFFSSEFSLARSVSRFPLLWLASFTTKSFAVMTINQHSIYLLYFICIPGVWKSRDELKAIRCSQALFQPKASIRDKFLKNFDEWKEALHRSTNWYKWDWFSLGTAENFVLFYFIVNSL